MRRERGERARGDIQNCWASPSLKVAPPNQLLDLTGAAFCFSVTCRRSSGPGRSVYSFGHRSVVC
jgi:hypothetical protein